MTLGAIAAYFFVISALTITERLLHVDEDVWLVRWPRLMHWGGVLVSTTFSVLLFLILCWYMLFAGKLATVLAAAEPDNIGSQEKAVFRVVNVMAQHRTGLLISRIGRRRGLHGYDESS